MYKIKQQPEDFVVEEITRLGDGIEIKDKGKYIYGILKKRNYTTLKALQVISYELGISLNNIGFAGNKDRIAVTQQAISIYDPGNRVRTKIGKFNSDYGTESLNLQFVGHGDCPISLGELRGNKFRIVIRNLGNRELLKLKKSDAKPLKFINLYGEQRFSKNNKDIGKLLLQKRFKDAVELIIKSEGEIENKITRYLNNYSNDYVNALKQIPRKLLLMYVHSYQSYLWNLAAEKILKKTKENIRIPVIGFGTNINSIKNAFVEKIVLDIMKKEKITERDFIIKQLPEVSAEGKSRNLFCDVIDFKIQEAEDDDLNKGKKKVALEFTLPKSSYATEVIRQIFQ